MPACQIHQFSFQSPNLLLEVGKIRQRRMMITRLFDLKKVQPDITKAYWRDFEGSKVYKVLFIICKPFARSRLWSEGKGSCLEVSCSNKLHIDLNIIFVCRGSWSLSLLGQHLSKRPCRSADGSANLFLLTLSWRELILAPQDGIPVDLSTRGCRVM